MAHIRALTVATTLPLAAVLLAGPPVDAVAEPLPPLPFGEIVSGSSSPGSAETGSGFEGSPMELGASAVELGLPGTGSAGGGYSTPVAGVAPLEIPPVVEDAAEPAVVADVPEGLPQPDSGSVRSACAGGVALGSALIMLGSATGSGLGSATGSGLGSATGSGLGLGLVGVGSSGSGTGSAAVGSAAVGSAVTGSALLCLLWPLDGIPPIPGIPLQLGPPPVVPASQGPAAPVPLLAAPPPVSDTPDPPAAQRVPHPPLARPLPTSDPVAWNLLQLLTILVVAVLSTVRGVAAVRRKL
ncbi:hypothetical protein [Nocardia sp. NPDC051832]|uniref:hypothetical protein n=1 Tax=Nocardia sp. NPDC051832 TaxID=3155673 RepID=UPI00341DF6C9